MYIYMAKQKELTEKIRRLLKEDTRGLTIQEIADSLSVSRITASIALARLEGMNVLDVRTIGNCRLHYLKLNLEKAKQRK